MTRQNKENFGYLKSQNIVRERACNNEIKSAGYQNEVFFNGGMDTKWS